MAIGLSGNVAKVVGQVAEQFLGLDRIITTTQASVKELAASMAGLTAEGRQAATAWREAAVAMKEAARAASGARVATAARPGVSAGVAAAMGGAAVAAGSYTALTYAPRGRQPSPALPPIQMPYFGRGVVPYGGGGALVPYWNGNTGFTMEGRPFTPYGGYSTAPVRGPGTSMVPYQGGGGWGGGPPPGTGFTMGPGGGWGGAFNVPGPAGPAMGMPVSPIGMTRAQAIALNRQVQGAAGPGGGGLTRGMAAAIPAWMGGEFLKDVWQRAASFDATKANLLAQGFTTEQVAAAEKAAYGTQRSILGTSAKGNLDIVSMLMAVVQDPNEALGLMPQYAKLGVLLNATGHGGEASELMDAIRAGEFRGVLTKTNPATGKPEVNTEGMSHFIQEMVAANIYTHGQVGPSQILQYLRSAGSAGALISDQELFGRTIALQMAMGSGRAGRSLQGFEQEFTAGRMSEATANLLIEMGIVQGGGTAKTNPYLRKAGMGQFLMMPDAMGADSFKEAMQSPVLFTMDKVFPKLQEMLHKKFGKDYDQADETTKLGMETAMATQIASRIPGGAELSEIIRNVLLIGRDVGAFDKAMSRDAYDIALQNNPLLRQQAFVNAWDALETALGNAAMIPAIHAMESLTGALNGLTDWAQKNPTVAKMALEGLAGAVIALGSGAALAALTALGGTVGLFAAVGAGAVILADGMEKLEKKLQNLLPWAFTQDQKDGKPGLPGGVPYIGKNSWMRWFLPGLPVTPDPMMTPDEGGFGPHGSPTAPNGVPHLGPLFGGQSFAPPAGAMGGGGSGGPLPVYLTNPGDLTRGIASGIANQTNRPPSGYTGVDPWIDPSNAYYGAVPP